MATDGEDTLSHNTAVENITEVLRGAGGEWLAQSYNQVCSDRVEYLGDSLFKRVPARGDTS